MNPPMISSSSSFLASSPIAVRLRYILDLNRAYLALGDSGLDRRMASKRSTALSGSPTMRSSAASSCSWISQSPSLVNDSFA